MICPNCGREILDQSIFCGYCGNRIDSQPPSSKALDMPALSGNEGEKKKNKTVSVILGLIAAALAVFCVILILQISSKNTEIAALSQEITSLNNTIIAKEKSNASLKKERNQFESDAKKYDQIASGIRYGNNGRGADHFKVSTPILYVKKGATETAKLTAFWPSGGTVSYSSDLWGIASLEYGSDTWSNSTDLKVTGIKTGVAVYTFTNNKDKYSFKMVVIVE